MVVGLGWAKMNSFLAEKTMSQVRTSSYLCSYIPLDGSQLHEMSSCVQTVPPTVTKLTHPRFRMDFQLLFADQVVYIAVVKSVMLFGLET